MVDQNLLGITKLNGVQRNVSNAAPPAYSMQPTDDIIVCNAVGGVQAVAVRPGAKAIGSVFLIISAAGTTTTLTAAAGDTIAGGATVVVASGANKEFIYDGVSNWIESDNGAAPGFTAGGDLTGTSVSQQVVSLTGLAGTLSIAATAAIFLWAAAATPVLTQATLGGTGATNGVNFSLTAQAGQLQNGGNANNNGGNFVISGGAKGTGGGGAVGVDGGVKLVDGAGFTIFACPAKSIVTNPAIYLGTAGDAPTASNYFAQGAGGVINVNAVTSLGLQVGASSRIVLSSILIQGTAGVSFAINGTASLGGGVGVFGMLNGTAPTSNPTGGCVLYAVGGGLGLRTDGGIAFVADKNKFATSFGLRRAVRVIAASATLTVADDVVIFSATGQTATLPLAPTAGDKYTVGLNAAAITNTYSIGGNGNNIIFQGAASATITVTTSAGGTGYEALTVMYDGTVWIAAAGY